MDVINAAKKISEAGGKLDILAKAVADQVCIVMRLTSSLTIFVNVET